MKLTLLLLLSAIILVFDLEGLAQPGPDPRISPLSICNEDYLSKEYVFLGQIRAVKEIPNPYGRPLWKTTVAIETSIKGQLSGEVVLTLPKPLLPPIPESEVLGKRFIFPAGRLTTANFRGLYTETWSTEIDKVSPDLMAKVIEGIRAVLRGVPQPRIVGTVREQSLETGFQAHEGRPLGGLAVLASSKNGQKFKTKTDAKGRFQFDKLPVGMYTVQLVLPKKMDLSAYGFMLEEEGKKYIRIDKWPCSRELIFTVQDTGSIVGRIEGVRGNQAVKPLLFLYPVDPTSLQIDPRLGPASVVHRSK